jgi:hypothetical protein
MLFHHDDNSRPVLRFWGPGARPKLGALYIAYIAQRFTGKLLYTYSSYNTFDDVHISRKPLVLSTSQDIVLYLVYALE